MINIYRSTELNKLIGQSLEELRRIYTNEQSIRIFMVITSFYYLYEIEQSSDQKVQRCKDIQENSIEEWIYFRIKQLENSDKELHDIITGIVDSFFHISNISTNREFKIVINNLNHFQFNNSKEIIQLINLLASKFVGGKENVGTPEAITNLAFNLVHIEHIHSFADYCSGISSFYIEMVKRVNASGKDNLPYYYGEEINVTVYLISKLLMFVNRISNFTIVNKNALDHVSKDDLRQSFDFIFSDIPFNLTWSPEKAWDDPRFEFGIPPRASADWAFYQNVLYHLNENGKAIVIGTKGTLVRSTEVHIRKSILDKDLIEAIITMPENLYSHTNISTELIIFNKSKPRERRNKILFIDASKFSHRMNKYQHEITEEGLTKIVAAYWDGDEEERFCRLMDAEKIRACNYSLNPKEYLEFDSLKSLYQNTVTLGEIAEIRRGAQISKEEFEDLKQSATHYFLNIKDIENGRIVYDEESKIACKKQDWLAKFAIQPLDILITSKGSLIKFAIVEDSFRESFISGNLSIIRVNPKRYDAYVLYEFLQSNTGRRMIDGIQTGTTIKLINPSKLVQLEIPLFTTEFMNEVGEGLMKSKQEYEETMKETEEIYVMKKTILLERMGINNKL
ncbi:N-6 DNA methylase [Paenibacillus sp. GSMTC-2017]|uniref:N-6 DNA methylase n=1 Tax=Paenibacillus sp. GSMTC-2017 TaxID=2794350 RepID=UPI0018D923F3|nr:N-6 DNA methylase [Paenibacillus sp. GSMTC-2017]MBH5317505.1 N-6 DNA methylase [Paenibacillus sp. GSMTC-2017]